MLMHANCAISFYDCQGLFSNQNTDTIKRLKRLHEENAEATANFVKAIAAGKAVDVLTLNHSSRGRR